MSKNDKAQISLPSDHEVEVTRDFNARRELVYEAYTDPKLVQRWLLGPPGWTMPVCEMDVRAGGKEFGFHGEFHEVSPPSRLVQSEFYDPGDVGGYMGDGALITVTFTERDGVTTMTSLMDFKTKAARDAAMSTGMTDGMEQSYQRLDQLLVEPA
jgi:uncharacterized protein YndB with AHSA1/START domain